MRAWVSYRWVALSTGWIMPTDPCLRALQSCKPTTSSWLASMGVRKIGSMPYGPTMLPLRRDRKQGRACLGVADLCIGRILCAGSPVFALQGDNAGRQCSRLAILELRCRRELLAARDLLALQRARNWKTYSSRLGILAFQPILWGAGARVPSLCGDDL